jgi:Glycosyltransferase family 9 (heptosyltransferase)
VGTIERCQGPPQSHPASAAERARATEVLASLTARIGGWPQPTAAQLDRLVALNGPDQHVVEARNVALYHAERAAAPLAGGNAGAEKWFVFASACREFATTLHQLGEVDAAEALAHDLVRLDPASHLWRGYLAQVLLRRGAYARGWVEYRRAVHLRRWSLDSQRFRTVPAWVPGEPLAGQTLLIAPDMGLGDMIWHYRYVPLVAAECGGWVTVEAAPPLERLTQYAFRGVAEVCAQPGSVVEPPRAQHDRWCLPSDPAEVFAREPAELPSGPYLSADPELIAHWGAMITSSAGGQLRVGLNWSGDPARIDDPRRIALDALAPLANVPGVVFFSLTKSASFSDPGWRRPADGGPEAEPAPERLDLVRLGPSFTDLADTAAAMMHLDLVVTCDTSVAHLAGALGRPSWVLLPAWGEVCWGSEAETTPWYPSVRLFRQERHGEWGPVVAQVVAELAALVRRGRRA